MPPSITICPAEPSETPAIGRIAEEAGLFPSDMLGDMIAGYLSAAAPDVWLVARADSETVGFAFCAPERLTDATWNLLAIAVHSKDRGVGVGARLVREVESHLRERNGRLLLVETLGTPEFDRTRRFYLSLGFVEEARVRDYYEEGGDKIIYWKQI
jgi:ribosomal protein S18 acetylase RimI-like enzyme